MKTFVLLTHSKISGMFKKILYYLFLFQPLHKAIFDPRAKGWIGPQKETHSKWAKARGAVMVSISTF